MPDDNIFNRDITAGETRAEWAQRFYTAASNTGRVFRTSDDNLLVKPRSGRPIRIVSLDQFDGILSEIVHVVRIRNDDGREQTRTSALDRGELNKLFHSETRSCLPLVTAIVHEPVVTPTSTGTYRLSYPGYNPETGIYYYVPDGEPPIDPSPGVDTLKECFSAVPFSEPGMFHNLLAWLLGGVCLDPTLDPPLLVVTGNQQGIGKSSVIQAAGTILTGFIPNPIEPQGSEFTKQLSAQFLENQRFVFLDNIVVRGGGAYDNTHLSTILTQGFSKRVRILGHSRSVSASGVLVAASLNDAKFSSDLSSRSLPVKLHCWEPRLHVPYCKLFAIEHRRRLYGELLWLALQGADDPSGDTSYIGCRFRRWLNFIRPRVETFLGPLKLADYSELDELTLEIFAFGSDAADNPNYFPKNQEGFTIADFINEITSKGTRYPALSSKIARGLGDRATQTLFGQLLATRANRPLTIDGESFVRLDRCATSRSARYRFVACDRAGAPIPQEDS